MKVKNLRLKSLKGSFWPLFSALILIFIFFWRVFLQGKIPLPGDFVLGVYYPWLDYKWSYEVGVPVKNPMTTDVVSLIYPEQMLSIAMLKKGVLPLWNPTILAGTPLLANLQALSIPTAFFYFFLDELEAWTLQIITAHLLVIFFSYLLLRHWRVSKLGSLIGGFIFSFSGFNLIFSQWNGHTLSSSFIPLIIYFLDKFLEEGEPKDGAAIVPCLGLQIISGYPQVVLYTGMAMGLFWFLRLLVNFRNKIFWVRSSFLAIFSLLGFGLSGFVFLPGAELWRLSQRPFEPHPFEWAFLPWSKVISFLAPDYFGNHATGNYWGPQDYTSNTGYVGVVVTLLALIPVSLLNKTRKNHHLIYLILLFIISLIFAFPTPISVFIWENDILGMRAASAHRITILTCFASAALAAIGIDLLLKSKTIKLKGTLLIPYLIVGGYLIITIYLFLVTRENSEKYEVIVRGIDKYQVGLRNLIFPVVTLGFSTAIIFLIKRFSGFRKLGTYLLLLVMICELFRFGWKFTPFFDEDLIFPTTPILEFLQNQQKPVRATGNRVIPVNMRTPYGLDSLEGYETIHSLRISQFLAAMNGGRVGTEPVGRYGTVDHDTSHLLDLLNTKYYLTLKVDKKNNPDINGQIPERFDTERFEKVFEDKTTVVMESVKVLPRAFMVYDWEVITNDEEILRKLLDPKYPYSKKIILEEEMGTSQLIESASQVEYQIYKEQESSIKVQTEKSGLLFVSDAFYPGWKAYVDGTETKIYRADFAFRAIRVPEGLHTIQFVYQPESFQNGVKLSLLSLGVLILIMTYLRRYTLT